MQSKNNKEIIGFLYYDDNQRLCMVNEAGSYVVLIESETPELSAARSLVVTESQDIIWHSGARETWDAGILDDLVHDLQEDGKDPNKEFSYENSKYSTIIISS